MCSDTVGEKPYTHRVRVKRIMRALCGPAFREYGCHAKVPNEEAHPMYRQCGRHYGHGTAGLYCGQHKSK